VPHAQISTPRDIRLCFFAFTVSNAPPRT